MNEIAPRQEDRDAKERQHPDDEQRQCCDQQKIHDHAHCCNREIAGLGESVSVRRLVGKQSAHGFRWCSWLIDVRIAGMEFSQIQRDTLHRSYVITALRLVANRSFVCRDLFFCSACLCVFGYFIFDNRRATSLVNRGVLALERLETSAANEPLTRYHLSR